MTIEGERHQALAVEAAGLLLLDRAEELLLVLACEQVRLGDAHAGAAASHARLHCESDASSAEPSADGGYATAALSAHTALPAPALAYTCVTLSRGRQ